MKRSQSILLTSVLVSAIIAFNLGWFFAKNIRTAAETPSSATNQVLKNDPEIFDSRVRDLNEVWARLQQYYYDASRLTLSKLEYSAVKGFVSGLGDPYTVFMPPDEAKDFSDDLEGLLEGIGAQLEVKQGKLTVVAPLKNSPAEAAGIRSGDIILKIDDKPAEEMTLFDAIKRIRGKKGTKVILTIVRENTPKALDITITRDKIVLESVTVKKLDGDIFHIAINQFNDHTKPEFQSAVNRILLEKAQGMILDLRGNGGGYLEVSVDMLSELITGDKTAVIVKKRDESKNEYIKLTNSARIPDIPLVVLADKGSASASEIVAGAIQDYRRGVVIGEKTFGKGSVQELIDLKDGASLRMTIAKWFTPLNRSIDEIGITPDYEVKITEENIKAGRDPQLEEAVKYLKNFKPLF